jgi:hypothetical protein
MKLGLIVLAAVALMGCGTNDAEAIKALDDQGFTSVSITDHGCMFAAWEGCDEKDGNWYHASATNPAGKRVNMLVCCGGAMAFKGCTVRSK